MITDLTPDSPVTPPDNEGGHTPDATLRGTILYVVRLDYFGAFPAAKQAKLDELNPLARKKAPVFYVGQTRLPAWKRYENHLQGYRASRWVEKHGQQLIKVDEWKPDFGVAVSADTIKAAWRLARRSNGDPGKREKALTELLRAQGFYVISN
ncbi:hypothetical protein EMGBS10_19370 [Opitutia bacterium]|jgi:hypothetical protein|nr:hypothetical protein EMGBS10_19370 [Opitutae bacterium]